jgi:hypothetical protein
MIDHICHRTASTGTVDGETCVTLFGSATAYRIDPICCRIAQRAKSSIGTVLITGISLGMMAVLLLASFAVLQHIGSILFVAALLNGPNQVKALFLSLAFHLE